MDLVKVIAIVLFCVSHNIWGIPRGPNEGFPLKLLRQEHAPSIEYKYVIKTILPIDKRWWKRGTHRFFAEESSPKIIEAK